MKLPMSFVLTLFACLWVNNTMADFVDIATLHINRTKIRVLTRNSRTPYLLNLDKYKKGDTLTVQVWTDHGAEYNSFVTLQNLKSLKVDTLGSGMRNRFILTDEVLSGESLISVTYIYPHIQGGMSTWDICRIIQDNRIEEIYETLNRFRDAALSDQPGLLNNLVTDSVMVNFSASRKNNKRILLDSMQYVSKKEIGNLFYLLDGEKVFFDKFNAIDYVGHLINYNRDYRMYGSIQIAEPDLTGMTLNVGQFDGSRLTLDFGWNGEVYLLNRIVYTN